MKKALFFFLLLSTQAIVGWCQTVVLDSLENELKHVNNSSKKAKLLISIAKEYRNINPEKQQQYALEALHLSKEIGYKEGSIDSYIQLGAAARRQGKYVDALKHIKKGLALSDENTDKKILASLFNYIAEIHRELGDFPTAADYYIQSLEINESLGNLRGIAINLNNLAAVFESQKDTDKAIDYYQKAYRTSKSADNQSAIAMTLHNLGRMYHERSLIDTTLSCYYNSLAICQNIGNKFGEAINLGNMGVAYGDIQNYDSAILLLRKSISLFEEMKNPYMLCSFKGSLGGVYHNMNAYAKAEKYLNESLETAKSIQASENMVKILKSLAELYKDTNRLSLSLEYLSKHTMLKDSIFNAQKDRQIKRLQISFETAKKEKENQILKQQAEIKDKALKLQRLISFGATFILLLTITLAIIIYRLYKRKAETNKKLVALNVDIHDQKEEIKLQAEKLQEANLKISNINANLEKTVLERTEKINAQNKKLIDYTLFNAHYIRGPLARILGLANLATHEVSIEEQTKIITLINTSAEELDVILNNLNETLQEEVGDENIFKKKDD